MSSMLSPWIKCSLLSSFETTYLVSPSLLTSGVVVVFIIFCLMYSLHWSLLVVYNCSIKFDLSDVVSSRMLPMLVINLDISSNDASWMTLAVLSFIWTISALWKSPSAVVRSFPYLFNISTHLTDEEGQWSLKELLE